MTLRTGIQAVILIQAAVSVAVYYWMGVFSATLFLGLLAAIIIIPGSIDSWTRQPWFFPAWAISSMFGSIGCLYAFRWAGSFDHKCDHLFVPLGMFAFAACMVVGALETRKTRNAL